MKKLFILVALIGFVNIGVFAQKYAYVDTEYILEQIPAYHSAQEQLNQIAEQYQKELEGIHTEIDQMHNDFQSEFALLSEDMKRKREDVILSKEKEYKNLQRKYFGDDGAIFRKREALIKPIQDDIFTVITQLAEQGNYAVIFDKSGGMNMLYSNPKYDLSDEILRRLGYKN